MNPSMYDYDMKVSCNSAIEAALQMLIITHGRATLHLFENSPEIPLPPQKNKYWEHICIYICNIFGESKKSNRRRNTCILGFCDKNIL